MFQVENRKFATIEQARDAANRIYEKTGNVVAITECAPVTYGLLLRRESRHGYKYLIAEIVKREGNHHAPRNPSDGLFREEGRPKHLADLHLSGLQMRGSVCDLESRPFSGYEAEFWDIHSISLPDARRMVKTLKLITDRARRDAAYTAPDYLVSLCAALRLSFVVECADDLPGSSYDAHRWRFMTIGEGRNRYRDMIEKMRGEQEAA